MSEYTAEMAHAAAARGAAWMDKHCSNWVREIDLTELSLEDTSLCVLGQTAQCLLPEFKRWTPSYSDVVDRLWPSASHRVATRLGFNVPINDRFDEYSTAYEMLTIAWKELIRQRLEATS